MKLIKAPPMLLSGCNFFRTFFPDYFTVYLSISQIALEDPFQRHSQKHSKHLKWEALKK